MEMHLVYAIKNRIWPNIWGEKNQNKNNTCSNDQKQIRKPSEGESALHQNTPQYCIH